MEEDMRQSRLAWWIPRLQSNDLVHFIAALVDSLIEIYEIEVFTELENVPVHAVAYTYQQYAERQNIQPFDLDVYFLSNDNVCRPIYERLLQKPGIAVLLESSLIRLYLYSTNDIDRSAFYDEVEYNYGLDTRTKVESIDYAGVIPKDNPYNDILLLRRMIEHSYAVVVADPLLQLRLTQRFPYKAIDALPIHDASARLGELGPLYGAVIERTLAHAPQPASRQFALRPGDGINFIGDLQTGSGLNEAAGNMLNAMLQYDIPVSYTQLPSTFNGAKNVVSPKYLSLPSGTIYSFNLLGYNIHQMAALSLEQLQSITNGKYTIGLWFWELPKIPEAWHPAFSRVDEIWVSSRYIQASMAAVTTKPVTLIPLSVEVITSPTVDRSAFGLPNERFVFFFNFAASSFHARKNPWGIIDAFEKAFAKYTSVRPLLVIKAHYLDRFPALGTALRNAVERVGGMLLEENYSRQQMNDLLACADAYVSLHRSEGFGLGIAESMCLGKPVIATHYSGNADFMTADNSFPVRYHLRTITAHDHRYEDPAAKFSSVYEVGQVWAEPDIEQAAEWMRYIYEHPDEARRRGRQAALDMHQRYGSLAVGRMIAERLSQLEPKSSALEHSSNQANLHTLQIRHHTLLREWQVLRESIERLPGADRAVIGSVVRMPLIRFTLRMLKRIRNLGRLNTAQEALSQAEFEIVQALIIAQSASFGSSAANGTDQTVTIAQFARQMSDIKQIIASLQCRIDMIDTNITSNTSLISDLSEVRAQLNEISRVVERNKHLYQD